MRHAQTVPGTGDPEGMVLGDCSTQRNLDERGKKQGADLREAFRAAGVTFSRVLSSPWCRCMDTARLVAPDVEAEASEALASSWLEDATSRQARAADARKIISEWRGPGNLLMVTHYVNASAISGAALGSGRFVVIDPTSMKIVLRQSGS
jgi:phosphohistidine phosphatase SixA